MKVTIDKDKCTGHGRCYSLADAVFSADESGFGEVVGDGRVAPDLAGRARLAAENCPERAIELEE